MTPAALLICAVVAVGDGDTLTCAGMEPRIRLDGIDAFERDQPQGALARRVLVEMVAGREIVCIPTATSWNRIVARCEIEGRDVSCALAAAGAGLIDERYDDRCADAETTAAFWGVGAHGGRYVTPWDWRH